MKAFTIECIIDCMQHFKFYSKQDILYFTRIRRFETKLEQYQGQLERAAIELSKDWRTDKYLRHLEALMIVTDKTDAFLISG